MKRQYGWHPSKPDHRDSAYGYALTAMPRAMPKAVDLRGHDNPIYDQMNLGSCVSNGVGDLWEFALRHAGKQHPLPSRLFIYYNGRDFEGSTQYDAGMEVRDGLKALAAYGCCDESLYPYLTDAKTFTQKPPKKVYDAAVKHKAITYHPVYLSLFQMQHCLASGFPLTLGFTVYESFESQAVARTGIVPMPSGHESTVGGHAVVVMGYDNAASHFIVRNSWGTGWGDKGYCYFPYDYLTNYNLASDGWMVRAVR